MSDRTIRIEQSWLDFCELLQFLNNLDNTAPHELLKLRKLYMDKLEKIVEHDLYSKYKTAPSEAEREEARRKYIDQKDIPEAFRW